MKDITICVAGDFFPSDRVAKLIKDGDYSKLLDNSILNTLKSSELNIVNLESPVFDEDLSPIEKTGPNLKAGTETIKYLSWANFNLLTLANNHIFDYGKEGLIKTLKNINAGNIPFIGAGLDKNEVNKIYFNTIGDKTLAIINVAENEWSTSVDDSIGANSINPVRNAKLIRDAKSKADFIIVITHSGHEGYELPSPRIKELLRFYVDCGADLIINHHPHCISGYEVYNDKHIYYSIGNFSFDIKQFRNNKWNIGILLKITINENSINPEVIFIKQGDIEPGVKVMEGDELTHIQLKFDKLSQLIKNDEGLANKFDEYAKMEYPQFSSYLEPFSLRVLNFLRLRGFFPSLNSKKKKRILLNIIRCESHRDLVIKTLEK
jgi:poly-gamma-glutamate capsule biosynthesis protein CapA/YwtB (metallophosphatase superfamily)